MTDKPTAVSLEEWEGAAMCASNGAVWALAQRQIDFLRSAQGAPRVTPEMIAKLQVLLIQIPKPGGGVLCECASHSCEINRYDGNKEITHGTIAIAAEDVRIAFAPLLTPPKPEKRTVREKIEAEVTVHNYHCDSVKRDRILADELDAIRAEMAGRKNG